MKLRIFENSIRIRLAQNEAASLAQGKEVSSTLLLGTSQGDGLRYGLVGCTSAKSLTLNWQNSSLLLTIPQAVISAWAESEQVGIYQTIADTVLEPVRVSIEKDFRCLQPRPGNDDLDTFDHPIATC